MPSKFQLSMILYHHINIDAKCTKICFNNLHVTSKLNLFFYFCTLRKNCHKKNCHSERKIKNKFGATFTDDSIPFTKPSSSKSRRTLI